MDSGGRDADAEVEVNGCKLEESKEEDDDEDDERKSLLPAPEAAAGRRRGGLAGKRGRSSSRRMRVQWNDRNGDKLAEVLEFQPSDSSDSEDEFSSRDCSWMLKLAAYIHICCRQSGPKV